MMMTLYHGSTHCVEHPLVALGRKNLDFISTYRAYHKDYSFDLHANPANLAKEKFSTYRTYHEYL